MSDDLVERVAREIYEKARDPRWPHFDELKGPALEYELNNARYSIAVLKPTIRREALEEAARVMLSRRARWWPDEACAAIRALVEKEPQ